MKMKHLLKGVCLWLLCLMLLLPAAMAEECFTIDVDALDMSRLNSNDYVAAHPEASVDYIHDVDATEALARQENAIGFIFDGMGKDQLFKTVICDGALPRKTFSMGHSADKRYYLECRKIK